MHSHNKFSPWCLAHHPFLLLEGISIYKTKETKKQRLGVTIGNWRKEEIIKKERHNVVIKLKYVKLKLSSILLQSKLPNHRESVEKV